MDGLATIAVDACPLCAASEFAVEYEGLRDWRLGVEGEWSFRRCLACRLVFLHPRPRDLAAAYPATYAQHRRRLSPALASRTSPLRTWVRKAILSAEGYDVDAGIATRVAGHGLVRIPDLRMRAHSGHWLMPARGTGTLLDYGCGNGGLLSFARLLGWDAVGIESDPVSAAMARDLAGAPVFPSLAEAALAEGSLAVVTMTHSLEHLEAPAEVLSGLRRLLRPGGLLGVAVPDWDSRHHRAEGRRWLGLDPPRHLVLFDRRRLRRLLEDSGFVAEAMTTWWSDGQIIAWASPASR